MEKEREEFERKLQQQQREQEQQEEQKQQKQHPLFGDSMWHVSVRTKRLCASARVMS